LAGYGVLSSRRPHGSTPPAQDRAGGTPEEVAADVAAELVGSKDAMRKAARHVALARLRSDLLVLVRMVEAGPCTLPSRWKGFPWRSSMPHRRARAGARGARSAQGDVRKGSSHGEAGDDRRSARRPSRPRARWRRSGRTTAPAAGCRRRNVVKTWATAVAALATMPPSTGASGPGAGAAIHRHGTESEGGNRDAARGRQALLDRPRRASHPHEAVRRAADGSLVCDMKDFTKRTAS